jgi:hypothetical protein
LADTWRRPEKIGLFGDWPRFSFSFQKNMSLPT